MKNGISGGNWGKLESDFINILNKELPEQEYQAFLETNSCLIPREFVQNHGIHFDLAFRKLSLAKDYTTDFFYLAKSSADWNCVLIEIEKPHSKYFRPGTTALHQDFLAALDQIHRWRGWFAVQGNFDGFINGTLKPVRVPHTMASNPCFIKYVLVTGRRSEYEGNSTRTNLISSYERDDFHILSYDSLLESLNSKSDLYIGVRKNELIEIVSEKFAGESLFSWMRPEQLRITEQLRRDLLAHRNEWRHYSSIGKLALDEALPNILSI